jgi:hypothetical protein
MPKLTVLIDDKLDKKFRETIFKAKGMRKGNLTEAVEEAMLLWIASADAPEKEKS